MTDFTNIQGALRSRAEYLKAVGSRLMMGLETMHRDGDMMYEAALYIERLELDKSVAAAQYASMTRSYNKVVDKLAAVTAERDKLYENCGPV